MGHSLEEWSEDKVTSLIPRRERKRENWEPSTDSHLNWRKWRGKTVKPRGQMENRKRKTASKERTNGSLTSFPTIRESTVRLSYPAS